jgi:hypothetical protein
MLVITRGQSFSQAKLRDQTEFAWRIWGLPTMIYSNWLEWNGLIYVQTNPKKSSVEKPNGGG